MPQISCRYYEQKYPEVDEVVMVNVVQIAEMGAYVKLLEYDGQKLYYCFEIIVIHISKFKDVNND